jgi:TonB family protein
MKSIRRVLALASALLCTSAAAALPTGMQCPAPQWPREALRYELEGTTTVEYNAGRDGAVRNVRVLKSSGWRLLDAASVQQVGLCTVPPDPARDESASGILQHVWLLEGIKSVRPSVVPGSCAPTVRFDELSHLTRPPRESLLVRFLVGRDGSPRGIVVESEAPPGVAAEAIAFVATCKFSYLPALPATPTDAGYGRVLLRAGSPAK